MFAREFQDGYRDVVGLCRVVPEAELLENRCTLIAAQYVHPAQRSAWLSGRRSVESILFKGFGTHTTNNRLIHERCAAIVASAIEVLNQSTYDEAPLKKLLGELSEMRRIVSAASGQLDEHSVDKSLDLIKKARDAIVRLAYLFHLGELLGQPPVASA